MITREYNILQAIGNTPLIQIGNVYAKLESVNPSGSIKDRVALEIIETAEREGLLKPGYTVVEASSGNTGISLAMIATAKGYKTIIVMPENMSEERQLMMKALGAKLVLIVGEEERQRNVVVLRDLAGKKQWEIPVEDIEREVNNFLERKRVDDGDG